MGHKALPPFVPYSSLDKSTLCPSLVDVRSTMEWWRPRYRRPTRPPDGSSAARRRRSWRCSCPRSPIATPPRWALLGERRLERGRPRRVHAAPRWSWGLPWPWPSRPPRSRARHWSGPPPASASLGGEGCTFVPPMSAGMPAWALTQAAPPPWRRCSVRAPVPWWSQRAQVRALARCRRSPSPSRGHPHSRRPRASGSAGRSRPAWHGGTPRRPARASSPSIGSPIERCHLQSWQMRWQGGGVERLMLWRGVGRVWPPLKNAFWWGPASRCVNARCRSGFLGRRSCLMAAYRWTGHWTGVVDSHPVPSSKRVSDIE